MKLHEKYKSLLNKYNINTPLRLAHFFAQLQHESNFKLVSENLNYSRTRLLEVFPKYFNSENVDDYAGKPEKIANRVYANRMGNGLETSGDGWKYRGKSYIQLTGYNNYKALSDATGVDYINNPDLLLNEPDAMLCACWFWSINSINKYADNDDVESVTRRINGGLNGLADRKKHLKKYKAIFK